MTPSWWENLAQMLEEAAEYLADHEHSSAGYLSRAAWTAHVIAEEEAAAERWHRHSSSRLRRGGPRRHWGCWRDSS